MRGKRPAHCLNKRQRIGALDVTLLRSMRETELGECYLL